LELEGSMKVGDLVRVDYEGWKVTEEAQYLRDILIYGIDVNKYIGGYNEYEYIMMWTTDGEYKTFPCDEQMPPTITVVSTGNH